MTTPATATITCDELRASLDADAPPRVFEALPEASHAAGHIPGAIAMPLDRVAEVAARFGSDRGREIVVYCASATCRNSDRVARQLTAMGYRSVRVFIGGKAEWKAAGLPLEVSR